MPLSIRICGCKERLGARLEEETPTIAYWLPCLGLGVYLLATRVFLNARTPLGHVMRVLLLIAIFQLGRLHEALTGDRYVWLLAAVSVACAGLSSRGDASAMLDRVR